MPLPPLLLLAAPAFAWEVQTTPDGVETAWGAMPIAYKVALDERLSGEAVEAVHQAFLTWSKVSEAEARFAGGESLDAPRAAGFDDTHSVFIDDAWPYGDEALALAATWADEASGEIVHFDLRINPDLPWGTDGEPEMYDLQSAITHEVGHVLGLDHSVEREAAMYAELEEGELRQVLHFDDEDAVRYLYAPAADEAGGPMPIACTTGPSGAPLLLLCLLPLGLRRRSS
jgi:hypothetical protein